VELHGVAYREPVLRELVELLLREKERVRGADKPLFAEPLRRLEQGLCHRCAVGVGPHEELRTRSGRKRHGGDELWVVRKPVLPVRVCPLPIEDVLPIAVSLEVEAERAEDASQVVFADEVDRRPATRAADAARTFQRAQELVVEERKIWRL
jgi:hypothetical protein